MQITKDVVDLVAEHIGKEPEEIKMSDHFIDDLGCDSLDTVEIVLLVEDQFDIEIPDHEAERMETVNSLVNYVTHEVEMKSA